MKTGRGQIELVSVFCPECHEAHYDDADHDWSVASFEGARPRQQVAGSVARCRQCGARFRMPSVIARIGE